MAELKPDIDIGAHLTISKGIPQAMEFAASIGATNFQYFPRNPRGGARRAIDDSEIAAGIQARAEFGIKSLICHLPYTVNPATPDERVADFAAKIISDDFELAVRMGADSVVLHPGFHMGAGVESGVESCGKLVSRVLAGYSGRTRLLFETMAGTGTVVGGNPQEIAGLIEAAGGHDWLGTCFDSCHLFAAGWDLRTREGLSSMLADWDREVGLARVGCFHLNDSKTPLLSHKDRHELIGRGHIGVDGIRNILSDRFVRSLPLVLETPVESLSDYAAEINVVMKLVR